MGVEHLSTPPISTPEKSTIQYRLWIQTSNDDLPGKKADVSVCLHGALGDVWLQGLDAMRPSSSFSKPLFGEGNYSEGEGGRCELYVAAQEVGTLQKVTVAYAHGSGSDVKHCVPWRLQQVVVRHGSDGIVTSFPASVELKAPSALLELLPRLSWHEDMYGNCLEVPPPPPPNGQWRWPRLPFEVNTLGAPGDEAGNVSEVEALQMKLYDAILAEEILPLADAAVHDLQMQRTPGSFLYECVQASTGSVLGAASAGSMDALRRYNVELSKQVEALSGKDGADRAKARSEIAVAQEQVRQLQAENALLRSAAEQNSAKLAALTSQTLSNQEAADPLNIASTPSMQPNQTIRSQTCLIS